MLHRTRSRTDLCHNGQARHRRSLTVANSSRSCDYASGRFELWSRKWGNLPRAGRVTPRRPQYAIKGRELSLRGLYWLSIHCAKAEIAHHVDVKPRSFSCDTILCHRLCARFSMASA